MPFPAPVVSRGSGENLDGVAIDVDNLNRCPNLRHGLRRAVRIDQAECEDCRDGEKVRSPRWRFPTGKPWKKSADLSRKPKESSGRG